MRLRGLLLLAAASLALVLPASANADAYHAVLSVYELHGTIPACRFSSSELEAALRLDAYGQQYFADFSDAVQNALAARAAGACTAEGIRARSTPAASVGSALPRSITSATSAGIPAPMVAVGALALLAALLAAVSFLTGAREPRWAPVWRHGRAEAGYKLGARRGVVRDALRRLLRSGDSEP